MPSIYSDYGFYRAVFSSASVTASVAAADTATIDNVITAKNANWTIHVQRITLSVTTDAAQSLTFQDDAGSPVVIAKSAASPGLGVEMVADFGPEGFPLTKGKNLDIVISGAGLACQISIEAYQRLTKSNAVAVASA